MREFIPLPDHRDVATLSPEGTFRLRRGSVPAVGRGDLLFQLVAAGIHAGGAAAVGEIAIAGDGASGFGPFDRALLTAPRLPGYERPVFEPVASTLHVPAAFRSAGSAFKLPEGFPADDATLLPATALAMRILREARVPDGGSLLVVGLGLLGQILVLVARHQRVERIFAADASPTLRRKAEYSGATRLIDPGKEDLRRVAAAERLALSAAVVCTDGTDGTEAAVSALDALGPEGALILAHDFADPASLMVRLSPLHRLGIRILGVPAPEARDLRAAAQTVRHGTVNSETLVSRRLRWEELAGADLGADYWTHGTQVVVEGPEDQRRHPDWA